MSAAGGPAVAVLGGGILGVLTALGLARRGRRVVLYEAQGAPLQGASRWNEGKIHLGFLYSADPSLRTARKVLPGAIAFAGLMERMLERPVAGLATEGDDLYLLHRDSVTDVDAFARHAAEVASLAREAEAEAESAGGGFRYLCDLGDAAVTPLSDTELRDITSSPDIVAGFRVPERSVSTNAIADLLLAALESEPRIETCTGHRVEAVTRRGDGRLDVTTQMVQSGSGATRSTFDVVVNALWEGRPAVDATMGILPPAPWSHRFRAALFAHVPGARLQSAMVCTGPFGDVKQVGDGHVYMSWYPAGLLAEGEELEPPRDAAVLDLATRERVLRESVAALSRFFPEVARIAPALDASAVHGGWVYAVGQGSLANRASTLHRRDRFDLHVDRGYISADTAKYSIAPWLADRIVRTIVGTIVH